MILADGTRFDGFLTGAAARPDWRGPIWGEVVFNTSMTGYQEVITDPSYAGQVVVMTYPQIGNYGVTLDDSEKPTTASPAPASIGSSSPTGGDIARSGTTYGSTRPTPWGTSR